MRVMRGLIGPRQRLTDAVVVSTRVSWKLTCLVNNGFLAVFMLTVSRNAPLAGGGNRCRGGMLALSGGRIAQGATNATFNECPEFDVTGNSAQLIGLRRRFRGRQTARVARA